MTARPGRQYNFNITLELTEALAFVPGELGTYLADGLFELDRADLLFPGLKTPKPGERVLSVSVQQTGYTRHAAAPEQATPVIINTVGTDEQRELFSALEDAALRISDLLRDLRLLKAKAQAMLDQLGTNTAWTKPQTRSAQALLEALQAVLESHATHVEPLL